MVKRPRADEICQVCHQAHSCADHALPRAPHDDQGSYSLSECHRAEAMPQHQPLISGNVGCNPI